MSRAYLVDRGTVASLKHRDAADDVVRQAIEGEQTARALLERLCTSSASGDELHEAAEGAGRQPSAWRRAFYRAVQKSLGH